MNYIGIVNVVKIFFKLLAWPTWSISLFETNLQRVNIVKLMQYKKYIDFVDT